MSIERQSRETRKLRELRNAQFRLKQRFERIDWEIDTLQPEIDALKAGKPVMGLPDAVAFDLVIEDDAHPAPTKTDDTE